MEKLSVADAAKKIQRYLERDTLLPYFVVTDSQNGEDLKNFFGDFSWLYVSDFCAGDSFLDVDLFIERLNALETDGLIFGLGEYVYFSGQENIVRALQDKSFNRKVVFVCRGIANLLERIAEEDFKFRANNLCRIGGNENFSVVQYATSATVPTDAQNFSELLKIMEGGQCSATVKSDLPLENVKELEVI